MNHDFESRLVPVIPEKNKPLRLILDTDAANEIDDLYAIALAVKSPERFRIEGLVATHFAGYAGPDSIGQSYELIQRLLAEAGMSGKFTVKKGGDPMAYPGTPSRSEGAEYIIEPDPDPDAAARQAAEFLLPMIQLYNESMGCQPASG